jgi:hypothetical protein
MVKFMIACTLVFFCFNSLPQLGQGPIYPFIKFAIVKWGEQLIHTYLILMELITYS